MHEGAQAWGLIGLRGRWTFVHGTFDFGSLPGSAKVCTLVGFLAVNSAKDLIRKLLVVDPTKRLSATEALQHQFILEGNFNPPSTPKGELEYRLPHNPCGNCVHSA